MNVDLALDKVVREAQQQLTSLQMSLRQLCADQDQQIDDSEDFKLCVEHEDQVCDFIEGLNRLLSELPLIAADIRGKPPNKESKLWYAEHKLARKEQAKKKGEEAKEAAKSRKELVAKMKLTSIEESKC